MPKLIHSVLTLLVVQDLWNIVQDWRRISVFKFKFHKSAHVETKLDVAILNLSLFPRKFLHYRNVNIFHRVRNA